jgi:hypothetical protein
MRVGRKVTLTGNEYLKQELNLACRWNERDGMLQLGTKERHGRDFLHSASHPMITPARPMTNIGILC